MNEPKIVLFDLETCPDLIEVMKVFPNIGQYPGLTLKASINTIICFGYKIFGEKETKCLSAWDYKQKSINDDFELVKAAYEILKDADAIVTHNGSRFDLKFFQTRLLKHKLPPLPKIRHVDTCLVAKRFLLMFNNRLNTLAKFLTSEEKMENGGWDLWVKVLQGDKKSKKLMVDYCKQDVNVLEKVFKRLRPFMTNIPNYNIFSRDADVICPKCGSTRYQNRGYRYTQVSAYQRHQCHDCHGYFTTDIKGKGAKSY